MNCRVETISSPSSKSAKIFHTSPEHPNARIIITPFCGPAEGRPRSPPYSRDISDPRRTSKPAARRSNLGSATICGRKRTVTEKCDDVSSSDEGYAKPKKAKRENQEPAITKSSPRRRKSSAELLKPTESTPKKGVGRPPSRPKSNRKKNPGLTRHENEELCEALQKQITIGLLKRRSVIHRTNS